MAEYRLSPRAKRDLDALFDHTVAQWGLAQALDYTDRIEAMCAAFAEAPLRAAGCDHIRPGYRRSAGQHGSYFRPTDYAIAVIRSCACGWTRAGIYKRERRRPRSSGC